MVGLNHIAGRDITESVDAQVYVIRFTVDLVSRILQVDGYSRN